MQRQREHAAARGPGQQPPSEGARPSSEAPAPEGGGGASPALAIDAAELRALDGAQEAAELRAPDSPPNSQARARDLLGPGMWLAGRWVPAPDRVCQDGARPSWSERSSGVQNLDVAGNRRWLAAAVATVARERAQEARRVGGATSPAPYPSDGLDGAFTGEQTAVWNEAEGWRIDGAEPVEPGTSRLDTVGIGQQVTVMTRFSEGVAGWLAGRGELTAAFRAARAAECAARARAIGPADTSADALRKALVSRRWWRGRAEGWRRRTRAVLECGTVRAWHASCGSCGTDREPMMLRCGLARECPRCCGRELGERQERVTRLMKAAEGQHARRMARRGPTVAHPLGRWGWRLVTLTVPPGAGVARDGSDVGKAYARLVRRIGDWLAKEGGEDASLAQLRAIEATVGRERSGHIHVHALWLAPYVPQHLIARIWGDEIGKLNRARSMPTADPGEIAKRVTHGPTLRLITHTRRGRAGRALDAVPYPVVDVRLADAGSIRELVKYAVKGIQADETADAMRWADVYCAVARLRLFASSRALAHDAPKVRRIEHLCCEACGVVGDWAHTTRTRGPPEDARAFKCAAV